jgi:hypothetical protein
MSKKAVISLITAVMMLAPVVALAQVNVNTIPGTTFGLGTADLQSTVVKIVQWVLGFLGLVALIMIIYGVFGAFFAGGDEDKVAFAKKTIIAAVIGLVVVLIAWAIVTFVVAQTGRVTE